MCIHIQEKNVHKQDYTEKCVSNEGLPAQWCIPIVSGTWEANVGEFQSQ